MAKEFKNLMDLGGLRTNLPADKIPNRNASDCANIDFSNQGMIQTRKGFNLFGNEITEVGKILCSYLYKKNYGTLKLIMLRVRQDDENSESVLEWFNPDHPDTQEGQWEKLVGSLTENAIMGFTPFNMTNANHLLFCNAEENFTEWNGATATVASVTSNTIVANETLSTEGFDASGSVLIDGTEYAYTGTSSKTFTGVTPDPTTQNPSASTGIAQKPDASTYSSHPKGNVLLTAGARCWVAGIDTEESSVYYSEVGDFTNFTAGTNPDDPGFEDFPDAGGKITLMDSKDNNKIIIHKEDGLLIFRLEYTGAAKIPYLDVITLAEDAGASNLKAGAGIDQISYYTTGRDALKSLYRALEGEQINVDNLSDIILPTIADYDFSDAATVYFPKKKAIYIACRSDDDEDYNDKVITLYFSRNASNQYVVDISIDDMYVSDWIVKENVLYAMSSISQNTYKIYGQYSDSGVGISHKWTTKEFTFNEPARGKEFNTIWLEGLIRVYTKIKITVLYGLLGSKGVSVKTISWDDDFVSEQDISALGTDIIGTTSLGASSDEIQESRAFAAPIHVDVNKSTRYKIKIETEYDSNTNPDSTYWAISNLSTNPVLKDVDYRDMVNTNV